MAGNTSNAVGSGVQAGAMSGNPWAGLAVAGASLLFGDDGSDEAARQEAQNRADQLAWNKQQDPFSSGGNREQYVPRLNELMQGGYTGVAQNPMFQQLNTQSMNDVQRAMSAKGYNMSGNEMNALRDTSQKNQMNFFNDQYTRLAELSGASRGGGAAPTGPSGQSIFNQNRTGQMDNISAFGGAIGSIANIYGQGNGSSTPTPEQFVDQNDIVLNG